MRAAGHQPSLVVAAYRMQGLVAHLRGREGGGREGGRREGGRRVRRKEEGGRKGKEEGREEGRRRRGREEGGE